MAVVGTASLKLRPDLTSFRKELDAGLRSLKAEITVTVQANVEKARATVTNFVRRENGETIKKNLDVDTKSAAAKVSALTGALAGPVSGAANLANRIQSVTLAASAAVAVAQAIGPLLVSAAGAAALIPAALIGGVGVMAALKLGADGAKKAFDLLTPTLDTLKSKVSASLFSGLEPGIQSLKGTLPQVTVGLQSIAMAAGQAFTGLARMLAEGGNAAKVNGIFIQTSQVVQNLGKGLAPFVQGLINIGAVGAPILTQLTAGIGGVAEKFAAWTASAEGAAKIQSVIQGSLTAFKTLGQILQQVGGIIANVFTGISSGAGNLGGSVLPVLTAINAALGSVQGQAALAALGAAVTALGQAFAGMLGPSLSAVLPVLTNVLNFVAAHAGTIAPLVAGVGLLAGAFVKLAPIISAVSGIFTALGPVLNVIFTFIRANPIMLLVGALVAALAASGQLTPILSMLMGIFQQLATSIMPVLNQLFSALMPILGQIASVIGGALAQVLMAILPPIGQLIGALLPPLVSIFTALMPIITTLAGFIGQLVNALAPILVLVAQLISALLPPLISLFVAVLTPVLNLAAALTGKIVSAISSVISWIGNLIGKLGGIQGVMDSVRGWFSSAWDFIKGVWSGVGGFFSGVWSGITSGLKGALNGAIRILNGAINGINLIPGVSIPHIPYLARGGTAEAGMAHIVGENGPELFIPGQTGRVVDNRNTVRAIAASGGGIGGNDSIAAAIADGLSRAVFEIDPTGIARINTRGVSANSRR